LLVRSLNRSLAHSLGPTNGDGGGGGADDGDNALALARDGSPVPVAKGARLEVSGARRAEGAVQLAAPVDIYLCASARSLARRSLARLLDRSLAQADEQATVAAAATTTAMATTTLARSLASRSLACLLARSMLARSLARADGRLRLLARSLVARSPACSLARIAPFPSLKARDSNAKRRVQMAPSSSWPQRARGSK